MNDRTIRPHLLFAALILGIMGTAAAALAPAPAEAAPPAPPCLMATATGTAPCPPPIVSRSGGSSIGGDANTDPVSASDGSENTYTYEAPTWTKADDDDEAETPAEPTDG
ncbi:membrane protein [Gordonia phage BiggityBass]|nr:membrane protein [Gordonia phage BiggityBass]